MTQPQLLEALSQPQGIITFSKTVKWAQWTPQHVAAFGAPTLPKRIVLEWDGVVATECFTEKQAFKKIHEGAEVLLQTLSLLWVVEYGQMLVQTPTFDLHVLRKGDRVTIKERPASRLHWSSPTQNIERTGSTVAQPDERRAPHALDVVHDAALLEQIDLLTIEGTIRASMADKYRQLNHLLGMVEALDLVRELKTGSVLHVIDAACGKAYLSLALTYVLKKRGIHVHLLGVDTNPHVIEHNRTVAARLGFSKAEFVVASIADVYKPADGSSGTDATKCDLLIALHACDTATDEAIVLGIRTNALAMLIAPCCHHHVQKQLRTSSKNALPALQPLLEDGIVRERLGDMLTDVMRRDIVRSYGYEAHLEEFIALEHTMKNILLKATKKNKKATDPKGLPPSVTLLMNEWKVAPFLATLLTSGR